MRDVIQKMVEAESQAKRAHDEAVTEAERLVAEARQKAKALLHQAEEEARTEAARIIEEARQAAEREKQERLAKAVSEIENQVRLDETVRLAATEAVVRCVSGGS